MKVQLLTVGDVARELGVAPETIRLWERLGKIPAVRTVSGYRLFRREDVDRVKAARVAGRGRKTAA